MWNYYLYFDSYMDSEKFEEAVRDYEKICQLDRSRGMLILHSVYAGKPQWLEHLWDRENSRHA